MQISNLQRVTQVTRKKKPGRLLSLEIWRVKVLRLRESSAVEAIGRGSQGAVRPERSVRWRRRRPRCVSAGRPNRPRDWRSAAPLGTASSAGRGGLTHFSFPPFIEPLLLTRKIGGVCGGGVSKKLDSLCLFTSSALFV